MVAGYLAGTTAPDRRGLTGLDGLRAGNVVAGSQVAALIMQAFGLRELVLAPWALREGVILETLAELGPSSEGQPGAPDPRRRSVLDFARRHAWDEAHCRQVTILVIRPDHRPARPRPGQARAAGGRRRPGGPAPRRPPRGRPVLPAQHSLYLIRNAGLDGWSPRELLLMVNVARYHRNALPSERHGDYMALDDADRVVVRRLAALLRVAEGLDADHFQVVESVDVVDEGPRLRLELRARDESDLWAAGQNADPGRGRVRPPGRPGRHRGRGARALRVPRAGALVG